MVSMALQGWWQTPALHGKAFERAWPSGPGKAPRVRRSSLLSIHPTTSSTVSRPAADLLQMFDALAADVLQLFQRAIEVGTFGLQLLDCPLHPAKQHLRLGDMGRVGVVELQVLADFLKGEPKVLAAQDQHQAGPVAPRVSARHAAARRCDQPLRFVEADGAGGDAEVARQLAD